MSLVLSLLIALFTHVAPIGSVSTGPTATPADVLSGGPSATAKPADVLSGGPSATVKPADVLSGGPSFH
jgi:hypothetical protein